MEKNNPGPQNRKYTRYDCEHPILYAKYQPRLDQAKMKWGKTINVSVEGALIVCQEEFKTGDSLTVDIKLPGWKQFYNKFYSGMPLANDAGLHTAAIIRNSKTAPDDKFLYGLHFPTLKAQDRHVLDEYIKNKLNFSL